MNIEVETRMIRTLVRGVVLTLVLAVTAWGIALVWFQPNTFNGGLNANECAAIAVLKNVVQAQQMFRERVVVDCDGDGIGEYGWFPELTGAAPLRGREPGQSIDAPVLSSAFGQLSEGRVSRSGYLFELWLPGANGTWIRHGSSVKVDPDAAELGFCIYAWPASADGGKRAFFADSAGDILANRNACGYCGPHAAPLVDAALPSSDADDERGPQGRRGRDGCDWVCVQ